MDEQYIAQITLFAGNYAPRSWAFCNGQLLPIKDNQALFTLLGITYGGDGISTFALPKLEGLSSGKVKVRYIIALEGIYPS